MGLQKMVKKNHIFLRCFVVSFMGVFLQVQRKIFGLSAFHYTNIFSAGPFHELLT
jgi:hypothetical protein